MKFCVALLRSEERSDEVRSSWPKARDSDGVSGTESEPGRVFVTVGEGYRATIFKQSYEVLFYSSKVTKFPVTKSFRSYPPRFANQNSAKNF